MIIFYSVIVESPSHFNTNILIDYSQNLVLFNEKNIKSFLCIQIDFNWFFIFIKIKDV